MRNLIENTTSAQTIRLAQKLLLVLAMLLITSSTTVLADENVQANRSQTTSQSGASASDNVRSTASSDALSDYVAGQSIFPSFMKITLALLAVILAIYLTLAFLKKAMGRKISSGGRANAIEVIETCYLAPKRSISLVRIGTRGALLSVSDSAIATLLELSSEETNEIVAMAGSRAGSPDFRQTLQKAKQKIVDLSSYATKHRDRARVKQVEQMGMK